MVEHKAGSMKILKINVTVCGLLSFVSLTKGYRILAIFPMPAKSHFACNAKVVKSLYDAGNEVTLITAVSNDESFKSYNVIDSRNNTPTFMATRKLGYVSKSEFLALMRNFGEKLCRDVLQLPEVQNLLNSGGEKYDIMLLELHMMYECFLPLAEKLDIPVVGTVTYRSWPYADAVIGNIRNPAVVPNFLGYHCDQMTFLQRLWNTLDYLVDEYQEYFNTNPILNRIYKDFYPPELLYKKKPSLVFYNSHFSLLPRSLVPGAIEIAGIHVKPAKPLPEDLQNFIDGSKHGVILFTFGSLTKASTMSSKTLSAFKQAFAQIPQRVIWKFEEPINNLTKNVWRSNWVPQRDILAHKNVKAFITHCGMSGINEAIHEAVPLVMAPLFDDQYSISSILGKRGVGVILDVHSVTSETVLNALNAIINDTRYYKHMKKLSEIFKDRPMSNQETIVYWTEYVIRHKGAPHLRTVDADMPLYQYLLLDVISFVIAIILLFTYFTFLLIKQFYRFYLKMFIIYQRSISMKKKDS